MAVGRMGGDGVFVRRHAEKHVREALQHMRVVAVVGPRQSGKTTLVRALARDLGMDYYTLDDENVLRMVRTDPQGFIERSQAPLVVDEIGRLPQLVLNIKRHVDLYPDPGRFLLTGSVDLFAGALSPDSLAGRLMNVELLPFATTEIFGQPPSLFLHRAFHRDFPHYQKITPWSRQLFQVMAGGFPEVCMQKEEDLRQKWLRSYVQRLTAKDIPEVFGTRKIKDLGDFVEQLAYFSGQLINMRTLAQGLGGVRVDTVQRWIYHLSQMWMIHCLPSWNKNLYKRFVKSSKLYFMDSGALAALRGWKVGRFDRFEPSVREDLGCLYETFVFTELRKMLSDEGVSGRLYHYRDKEQYEVDFVVERGRDILGVEVKAASSVCAEDFRGLCKLQKVITGSQIERSQRYAFVCGIVLYDGDVLWRYEEHMYAMPLSMLWHPMLQHQAPVLT